jgi:UDP-N-acetylglucosamine--N-acetylmuramyl-(pentapeptide) pyrophosphoryl-undecaprenol N-acetylglucosamine transferase
MTPALILARELQKNGYTNIIWLGKKYTQAGDSATSPEFQLVNELSIPYINLSTGKFWRVWNQDTFSQALIDLLLIPWGFLASFLICIRHKPDIIVSFGGYVALPIVIVGKLFFRKKIVTHEQVLAPGLANKIIAKFADKILISWKKAAKFFPEQKTVLTGNPSWILNQKPSDFELSFPDELPIITIVGGNQGAHAINVAIFSILENLLRSANTVHQTGRSEITKDKYKAADIKSNLSDTLASRYIYKPFIVGEEFPDIMEKSDLIISRGGANMMTDIIIKGKKCIIIPLPRSSNNEQLKNAKFLKKLGLGTIIKYENDINPQDLLDEIRARLKEKQGNLSPEVRELQTLIRYAPKKIYKEVISLLE